MSLCLLARLLEERLPPATYSIYGYVTRLPGDLVGDALLDDATLNWGISAFFDEDDDDGLEADVLPLAMFNVD